MDKRQIPMEEYSNAELAAEALAHAEDAEAGLATGNSPLYRALAERLKASEEAEEHFRAQTEEHFRAQTEVLIDTAKRLYELAAAVESTLRYAEVCHEDAEVDGMIEILSAAPADVLREHDAKVRAEEREKCAQIAEVWDSGRGRVARRIRNGKTKR